MAPPVVVRANVMQYGAHRHRRCPHCIGAARHRRVTFSIHDKGELMARRFMAAAAVGAMLLVACGSDKKSETTVPRPEAPLPVAAAQRDRRQRRKPRLQPTDTVGDGSTDCNRPSDTTARRRLGDGLVGDTPATAGPDCGLGQWPEGDRRPDQARQRHDVGARHRLHDWPGDDEGLLRLRQRQRWHQRPTCPDARRERQPQARRRRGCSS